MPSTAGRVRMPANNRVTTSSSLHVNKAFTNAVGYDPYAAPGEASAAASQSQEMLERSKGLMELAKLSSDSTTNRSTCKKCNGIGHLSFQCRNHLAVSLPGANESKYEDLSESEDDAPVPAHAVPPQPPYNPPPPILNDPVNLTRSGNVEAMGDKKRERGRVRSRSRTRSRSRSRDRRRRRSSSRSRDRHRRSPSRSRDRRRRSPSDSRDRHGHKRRRRSRSQERNRARRRSSSRSESSVGSERSTDRHRHRHHRHHHRHRRHGKHHTRDSHKRNDKGGETEKDAEKFDKGE